MGNSFLGIFYHDIKNKELKQYAAAWANLYFSLYYLSDIFLPLRDFLSPFFHPSFLSALLYLALFPHLQNFH